MPEMLTNFEVMKNFLIKTEHLVIHLSIGQLRMFCPKYMGFNIKVRLLAPTLQNTQ